MSHPSSVRSLSGRLSSWLVLDWTAALLVAAMAVVQLGALEIAGSLLSAPSSPQPAQTSNPSQGGLTVGVIVVETVVLVLLWRLASWLPAWLRRGLKYGILGSIGITASWLVHLLLGGGVRGAALTVGLAAAGGLISLAGMYWTLHNALALSLGIIAAVAVGFAFSPAVAVVFLLALCVWDMVAVWGSGWMDGLVDAAAHARAPVFVVLPDALRPSMSELADWIGDREGPKPNGVAGIIGVGDLAVPAGLTVSAAVAHGGVESLAAVGAAVGAVAAMPVLRASLGGRDGLPAMPWVAAGSIGGYVVGVLGGGFA